MLLCEKCYLRFLKELTFPLSNYSVGINRSKSQGFGPLGGKENLLTFRDKIL